MEFNWWNGKGGIDGINEPHGIKRNWRNCRNWWNEIKLMASMEWIKLLECSYEIGIESTVVIWMNWGHGNYVIDGFNQTN